MEPSRLMLIFCSARVVVSVRKSPSRRGHHDSKSHRVAPNVISAKRKVHTFFYVNQFMFFGSGSIRGFHERSRRARPGIPEAEAASLGCRQAESES